jgi:flagellar hook-associated protein 3
MRVTHKMMVNNVTYWLSKQAEKLNDAQTKVATGKQINKPSDDPLAEGRILVDRTTISAYAQYQANIDQAITWIEASETTLNAVDTLAQQAQDIVLEQMSGDLESRDTALEQLQSIYDQIIDLANTKYGSSYMYSGNCTDVTPFTNEVTVSDGSSSDILFDLAEDASDVTIEITNSAGKVVRTLDVSGGGTEGTNTVAWDGLDDNGDPLPDSQYDFSVSASNSTGDGVAAYPAYQGDEGGKQVIVGENSVVVLNNNGGEIFSEIFSTMSRLIAALEASDYDTDLVSELNTSLEEGIDQITAERVALSNVNSQLSTADDRLDRLSLDIEDKISENEVGSDDQAAIELQAQETAYEVTLETASTILKMKKLADYFA